MFVNALSVSTEHWTSTAIPQTDLQIAWFFEYLKEKSNKQILIYLGFIINSANLLHVKHWVSFCSSDAHVYLNIEQESEIRSLAVTWDVC